MLALIEGAFAERSDGHPGQLSRVGPDKQAHLGRLAASAILALLCDTVCGCIHGDWPHKGHLRPFGIPWSRVATRRRVDFAQSRQPQGPPGTPVGTFDLGQVLVHEVGAVLPGQDSGTKTRFSQRFEVGDPAVPARTPRLRAKARPRGCHGCERAGEARRSREGEMARQRGQHRLTTSHGPDGGIHGLGL